MALQFYFDYLKHKFTSKTRHGTHSPFVYKLVDEVIYDFNPKKDYEAIEFQRQKLLNNTTVIEVTDLGAGSMLHKDRKKTVKIIAKNALKRPDLAQLLFRITQYFKPESVIELGTCLGITTAYFSIANPMSKVTTIEGCAQTAAIAQQNFQELGLNNVNSLVGNFDDVFPDILAQHTKIDFVYIDGNHTKEATLRYFKQCLPKINDNSVLIFDDIYWSEGMKEAWEIIKSNPKVSVTIDLFWIGLVFFKKDQAKEHFKIKF